MYRPTIYPAVRSLPQRQRGATLVTVMIIMVLVTLLGLSAMRMSVSSLALATNSQVTNLVFQSADTGINTMVNRISSDPKTAVTTGVLKDAIANLGTEYRFCLTPMTTPAAQLLPFTTGTCDVTLNTTNYMSTRAAVAVQVTLQTKQLDPTLATQFGSDPSAAPQMGYTVMMYSTAVLPSLGSASQAAINGCLANTNDEMVDRTKATGTLDNTITTVTDCLTDAGAVFNSQLDERVLMSFFQL